jgi:hypothetical protein
MKSGDTHHAFSDPGPRGTSVGLIVISSLLVLMGAGAFMVGIRGPQATRVWQAYLINLLFWSGLSYGSIFFVVILNMTSARWARPMKRLAEAPGAFLPIAFLLFWVLWVGKEEIFPWIKAPIAEKAAWLDATLLFARDGGALFLITAATLALLYFSVKGDLLVLRAMRDRRSIHEPSQDEGSESLSAIRKTWQAQKLLSPIFAVLYFVALTLLAWDLVMSLDPQWTSTLFGAYYFIGCLYTAVAAVVVLSVVARQRMGLKPFIQPGHFHDLGKFLLAFLLITGDFFFSQYLLIWYGNIPEETHFLILRYRFEPWRTVSWAILLLIFGLPFLALLSRRLKMKPAPMLIIGAIILVGMWLERFLLVAPSLWSGGGLPLGHWELMISLGYLGLVVLCVRLFLGRCPLLPLSDPMFRGSWPATGDLDEAGSIPSVEV